MTRSERLTRAGFGRTTVLVGCLSSAGASLFPLILGSWWWLATVAVTAVVLYAAAGLRWVTPRAALASIGTCIIAVLIGGIAVAGVIASGIDTAGGVFRALGQDAYTTIVTQPYPVLVGPGLFILILGASLVVACVADLAVFVARVPAVIALLQASFFLPPAIIAGEVSWVIVLLSAALFLVLLALDQGAYRPRPVGRGISWSRAGVTGVAVLSVVALAAGAAGVVPGSDGSRPYSGGPGGTAVRPLISLGQDLVRGQRREVLEMTSTAENAPYLRTAVLNEATFDGWREGDAELSIPATSSQRNRVPGLADGSSAELIETTITPIDVQGDTLPVPYPAIAVDPADERWSWGALSLTLDTPGGVAADEPVTVTSLQLRSLNGRIVPGVSSFGSAQISANDPTLRVPQDAPQSILTTALDVAGSETTAFGVGVALEDYFRSGGFEYSESAPSRGGYDGDSMEMIARFLEVQSGYCVHYASAMTTMARMLGVPARIAVGYLPGTPTSASDGASRIVTTDDAHAWPELYIDGVGWTPFEPTPSRAGTSDSGPDPAPDDAEQPEEDIDPAEDPTPEPDELPGLPDDQAGSGESGDAERMELPAWLSGAIGALLGVLALVSVVLVLPTLRVVIGRRRFARAIDPSVAAWSELEATLVDLGGRPGRGDSMQQIADGWEQDPGGAVHRLAASASRALFSPMSGEAGARSGSADEWRMEPQAELQADLRDAKRVVRSCFGRWRRTLAWFVPVSLFRWRR